MTELFYRFPCGCQIKQLSDTIKSYDGLPPLEIDYYNLPLICPATWALVSSGRTRGIFQLESNLGRSYSKKLEPDNIEHMGALGAILRPGSMNSFLDDKNMTNHYIDRKQKREEIPETDSRIEECLSSSYGVLIYQEQIMALCKKVARFNGQETEKLLKGVKKKKPEIIASMKDRFISGCIDNGISEEQANTLYNNIESSNRYSFSRCLSPTTLVETKSGEFKTLEEVEIGEFIVAPDEGGCDSFVEVVDKFDNGEKEVYEVTLESGNQIVCTLDHKFMCENGEILPLIEILEKNLRVFYQI